MLNRKGKRLLQNSKIIAGTFLLGLVLQYVYELGRTEDVALFFAYVLLVFTLLLVLGLLVDHLVIFALTSLTSGALGHILFEISQYLAYNSRESTSDLQNCPHGEMHESVPPAVFVLGLAFESLAMLGVLGWIVLVSLSGRPDCFVRLWSYDMFPPTDSLSETAKESYGTLKKVAGVFTVGLVWQCIYDFGRIDFQDSLEILLLFGMICHLTSMLFLVVWLFHADWHAVVWFGGVSGWIGLVLTCVFQFLEWGRGNPPYQHNIIGKCHYSHQNVPVEVFLVALILQLIACAAAFAAFIFFVYSTRVTNPFFSERLSRSSVSTTPPPGVRGERRASEDHLLSA